MSAALLDWLAWNALGALPLALLARMLERRTEARPAWVHLAWSLVLVRLVLPPLPGLELPSLSTAAARALLAAYFSLSAGADGARLYQDTLSARAALHAPRLLDVLACAAALWSATALLREVVLHHALARSMRAAPQAPTWLQSAVDSEARGLGVRTPRVALVDGLRCPCLFGLFRPVLLWPSSMSALRGGERAVLAHELAHLARRENAWSLLGLAVHALHGWNPLARKALRAQRAAAELVCDARALERHPGERSRFANLLLEAASGPAPRSRTSAALHGGALAELESRLHALYAPTPSARVTSSALTAAAFALSLTAAAPLAVPPLGVHSASANRELRAQAQVKESDEELQALISGLDGEGARLLGLELFLARRHALAALAFERQFAAGYLPQWAQYNLACARVALGELERAAEHFERAVELDAAVLKSYALDPDLAALAASPWGKRWSAPSH